MGGGELNRGLIRGLVAPIHPPTPNKQSPPLGCLWWALKSPKTIILNRPTSFLLPTCPLSPPSSVRPSSQFHFACPLCPLSRLLVRTKPFSSLFPRARRRRRGRRRRQTDDDNRRRRRRLLLTGRCCCWACLLACCFVAERARELSLLRLVCMHERAAVAQAMEGW